jgi:hypothetical protein
MTDADNNVPAPDPRLLAKIPARELRRAAMKRSAFARGTKWAAGPATLEELRRLSTADTSVSALTDWDDLLWPSIVIWRAIKGPGEWVSAASVQHFWREHGCGESTTENDMHDPHYWHWFAAGAADQCRRDSRKIDAILRVESNVGLDEAPY